MSCEKCKRIEQEAKNSWLHQFNRINDLQDKLDSRFVFTPLWIITCLFVAAIIITVVAVKSFEYGAIQVATGKLHCVTKDHNTMCEEVKK